MTAFKLISQKYPTHFMLPLAALLSQIIVGLLLWQLAYFVYDGGGLGWEETLSSLTNLLLALGGLSGGALATAAIYRLVREAQWWVAVLLIGLVCLPVLFLSWSWLYALSMFTGWV